MKGLHIALLLWLGLALIPASSGRASQQAEAPKDSLFAKGAEALKMFHIDKAIADFVPYSLYYAKQPLADQKNRKRLAHKLLWIARGFSFDENNRAARQLLSIAQQLDPDNTYIKCFLSDEYSSLGDFEKSAQLDAQLKPLAEKDVYVSRSLISHLNRRRDLLAALALLEKTEKLPEAKDFAFLHWIHAVTTNSLGATPEAMKWYTRAASETDSPYLQKIYTAAAFQSGQQHDAAERALTEAGQINPSDPTWHSMLGLTLGIGGQIHLARQEYLAALMCRRCSSNIHNSAAKFFSSADKTKDNAFRTLDHIEKLTPWRGSIHAARAKIYMSDNQNEKAKAEYKKQIELDKYLFEGYMELSNMALKDGKSQEAFDWANRALELYPTNRFVWEQLGGLQRKTAHPKEAAEAYHKVLELMLKPFDRLNVVAKSEVATVYANSGTWAYLQAKDLATQIVALKKEQLGGAGGPKEAQAAPQAAASESRMKSLEAAKAKLDEQALAEAKLFNQFKFVAELPAHLRWVKIRPARISFENKDKDVAKANQHVVLADMLTETERTKDAIAEYRAALAITPDNMELHSFLFQELQKDGDWMEAAKEDVVISQKLINSIPGAVGLGEKK